jgi:hypothetical protein
MDEEKVTSGVTRRRLMKRAGAGAALVWAAPVLSSLSTPAYAQASPVCGTGCPACPPDLCGSDARGPCLCFPPIDGSTCVCTSPRACAGIECDSDAGCPSGQKCVFSCCPTGTCALPCGAEGAGAGAKGAGTQAG